MTANRTPEWRERQKQYHREWRAKHREEQAAKARARYAANSDKERARRRTPEHQEARRKYREAHRDQIRAYDLANREKTRADLKTWRANNKARYLASEAAWREKNRERLREYQRQWRAGRRTILNEQQRARYAANPDRNLAYQRVRSLRRRLAIELHGAHTAYQWEVKLLVFGGGCANCGTTERVERDHITPLSRGGSDLIENLQPLCRSCNASKSARLAA